MYTIQKRRGSFKFFWTGASWSNDEGSARKYATVMDARAAFTTAVETDHQVFDYHAWINAEG